MAAPRHTPPASRLREYVERGLTQQEMVTAWEAESNYAVTTKAISVALYRAGLTRPRLRHRRAVPWRVALKDQRNTHIQMLRALSRQRRGDDLPQHTQEHLEGWLKRIDGLLVMYVQGDGAYAVVADTVPEHLRDDQFPIVLLDGDGRPFTEEELSEFERQDAASEARWVGA